MRPPVTVPIDALNGLLSGLRARAAENPDWFAALLARAGVAPSLMDQPNARVTVEQFVAVFTVFMEDLDDEFLGLLSRPLRCGSFALLAQSTIGAPTLEVALRRLARALRVLQDDVRLACVHDGELTGLTLEFPDPSIVRQNAVHELLLRVIWRLLFWLQDGKLMPRRFDFSFAEPPYSAIYADILPGPMRYSQPRSAVWFDRTALAAPVRRDHKALQAFLHSAPLSMMGPRRIAEPGVTARVRAVLQRSKLAWPGLEQTAAHLHMSVSTLQRHLAAESTSFQEVKDEMRRDLAVVRLNTSDVPLSVLADELGFADSAAFQRAFKTWTGSAAGTYRARVVNEDAKRG